MRNFRPFIFFIRVLIWEKGAGAVSALSIMLVNVEQGIWLKNYYLLLASGGWEKFYDETGRRTGDIYFQNKTFGGCRIDVLGLIKTVDKNRH